MLHTEGFFTGVRDLSIYHQAWLPEGEIKAAILVIHGLGEHCSRYTNVVNYLVPRGYAVFGLDLPGHGKSGGTREYVNQFNEFSETLTSYLQRVKAELPDKPVFLLGHSLGGTISAKYMIEHSNGYFGAIISAPTIIIPDYVTQFTIMAGKILSILAPKTGILPLDPNGVSRDPAVVQAYKDDPLVFHGKTSARLAAETLQAIIKINNEVEKITSPLMIVQGSEDLLANPEGSQMLYDRAGSTDKTLKIYDGLHHEIFNEPEHEMVLGDVAAWLDAHL
jgi:acylglycerol lipase